MASPLILPQRRPLVRPRPRPWLPRARPARRKLQSSLWPADLRQHVATPGEPLWMPSYDLSQCCECGGCCPSPPECLAHSLTSSCDNFPTCNGILIQVAATGVEQFWSNTGGITCNEPHQVLFIQVYCDDGVYSYFVQFECGLFSQSSSGVLTLVSCDPFHLTGTFGFQPNDPDFPDDVCCDEEQTLTVDIVAGECPE